MNTALNEALAQLNLQPGEVYQTTVNGQEMEVRALQTADAAEAVDEPSPFADQEMLTLWLDVPPSPAAKTITVQLGEPLLPPPFHLDESDLAPE
jgi:hypothetical protein